MLFRSKIYRLPTEAEWEYACRCGTQAAFCFGNDEGELSKYAWFDKTAFDVNEKYAHRVAEKLPNAFGLHDMHGNVWEWCSDWYAAYPADSLTDPRGPDTGTSRVLRGGSWLYGPDFLRCASRNGHVPQSLDLSHGFRLVLE